MGYQLLEWTSVYYCTDYEGYIDKKGNLIYQYDMEGWSYIDAYFDVHY
ncbi:hypothetical protein [Bacillus sp. LL01]|nr:hypothetical protein [Bacillus sp. LL01]